MTAKDLLTFCEQSADSPYGAPWSHGANTYATNQRVLIRVPKLADVPPGGPCPLIEESLWQPAGVPAIQFDVPLPPARAVCPNCNGTGIVAQFEKHIPIPVGGINISHVYLRMLKTLPGCVIHPGARGDLSPARFFFECGDGWVMPMRTD